MLESIITTFVKRQEGFALIVALLAATAVIIIGLSVLTVSMMNAESSASMSISQQNFQMADAAAEIGKSWLAAYTIPPERIVTDAPFAKYTPWSSEFNPINPSTGKAYPFPEFRYRVDHVKDAFQSTGQTRTVGTEYGVSLPVWHFYKITAEARGGQTAARGTNQPDKTIVMVCRRLYLD